MRGGGRKPRGNECAGAPAGRATIPPASRTPSPGLGRILAFGVLGPSSRGQHHPRPLLALPGLPAQSDRLGVTAPFPAPVPGAPSTAVTGHPSHPGQRPTSGSHSPRHAGHQRGPECPWPRPLRGRQRLLDSSAEAGGPDVAWLGGDRRPPRRAQLVAVTEAHSGSLSRTPAHRAALSRALCLFRNETHASWCRSGADVPLSSGDSGTGR